MSKAKRSKVGRHLAAEAPAPTPVSPSPSSHGEAFFQTGRYQPELVAARRRAELEQAREKAALEASPDAAPPALDQAAQPPALGKGSELPAITAAPGISVLLQDEEPEVSPSPTPATPTPATATPANPAPVATSPATTPADPYANPYLPAAARIPRVAVTEVQPVIEEGRWPAKAVEMEAFPVQATVFRDGHYVFAAEAVLLRAAPGQNAASPNFALYQDLDAIKWEVAGRAPMREVAVGLSRYEAWLCPDSVGLWGFQIETYSDPYLSWVHAATVKIQNGVDVELMLEEGARLLERAIAGQALNNPAQEPLPPADAAVLAEAAAMLRNQERAPQTRLSAGVHSHVRRIMRLHPLRDLMTRSRIYPLRVDRERALAGSWYEIFPRDEGAYRGPDGQIVPGNLRTAAEILPWVAQCGYDVIYLTPISPIGTTFRKGKNNSLTAAPGDPGSPYAIGSPDGGHDAIHPELGTFEDFDHFVSQARALGLEVALDIALQCSPDHPWVAAHPEWFTPRADGSIAYAENPPKKYQDIYPLNFDNDYRGLYNAIRDMLEVWVSHGVTIFRIDNPHTKPVAFWQELLAEFQVKHPEVIFLAEAFTKPAMMRGLAQVGFQQSYTYFAWRNDKQEIIDYLQELAYVTAPVMRPTFWPITHDILTPYMQQGGAPAFRARALLAATASPTWGVLRGYEFVENVAREGVEEQVDNPKYEYKLRDWSHANDLGLQSLLTTLNRVRAEHVALRRLRNITFHESESDQILCFSKHVPARFSPTGEDDTVLVVINLNPHNRVDTWIHLDLAALGLPLGGMSAGGALFRVHDEISGADYEWGRDNFVSLDPYLTPGHLFTIHPL